MYYNLARMYTFANVLFKCILRQQDLKKPKENFLMEMMSVVWPHKILRLTFDDLLMTAIVPQHDFFYSQPWTSHTTIQINFLSCISNHFVCASLKTILSFVLKYLFYSHKKAKQILKAFLIAREICYLLFCGNGSSQDNLSSWHHLLIPLFLNRLAFLIRISLTFGELAFTLFLRAHFINAR